MDIPMPPVLQSRSMADYMKEYADAQGSVQQNAMNAIKLQRAPKEFAMKDRADQLAIDDGETKQQNQKLMMGSGMAKAVLTRASNEAKAQGIPEGTPEYDQIINKIGHYYAPQLSKVFGKEYDPATPIDVNAVRTLAAYDGNGGEARNHLQAITGQDGRQYQFDTMNGGPAQPIMYGGQQIINPTHNPKAQGEIARSKESENIIEVTGPNGEKFHIPAGVAAGYSRQPQAVNIDPRMAPQDMAGAENVGATPEDLQNMQGNKFDYQISPSGQKLGLSVNGPITGPTMQEQERVKRESNVNEAQQKAEIEINKATETTQRKNENSANAILSRLSTPIDGKSIDALIDESTGSGAGVIRDNVMNFMGKTSDAANAAATLKTIEGWLTSSVPRMEGPQGEKDVALYKSMAADIGDPSVPPQQKKKKLLALKAMMQAQTAMSKPKDIHSQADDILRGQ